MKHTILALTTLLLALHAADGPKQSRSAAKTAGGNPNILVILADDLGYGDVQCYNPERGKIPTPNIDRLAAQGMRFTDGHSSSGVCSPSRYTLLTGRYHWRTRLQSGIVGVLGEPLDRAGSPDDRHAGEAARLPHRLHRQMASRLGLADPERSSAVLSFSKPMKPQGDRPPPPSAPPAQIVAGASFPKPIAGGPTTRGFDHYFGTDVPNWPPYCFIENDRTVGIPTRVPARDCLSATTRPASRAPR